MKRSNLERFTQRVLICGALLCMAPAGRLEAFEPVKLVDVVAMAVNNSPDVNAKYHEIRDYEEQGKAASGGYLPQVKASAQAGRQGYWVEGTTPNKYVWNKSLRLELSQMLFDGFGTRNQVRSLKSAEKAKYFEFLDAVENVAYESARAYSDVLRYRELATLSEHNIWHHKGIYAQIKSRVNAGVSGSADLEQVGSRLNLARSQHLTELNNLREASLRYKRFTGVEPASALQIEMVPDRNIPAYESDALKEAYEHNPAYLAAEENVVGAEKQVNVQRSRFYPKLELKAIHETAWDTNGINGQLNNNQIAVALSYNIFSGGTDAATVREYKERMYRTKDLRETSERVVRQNLFQAISTRQTTNGQIGYLDSQRKNLDKVRLAYREQFNIGKRTLLDLLDSESEYYLSQRNYYNAFFDLSIANAKILSSMGKLLSTLDIVSDKDSSLSNNRYH